MPRHAHSHEILQNFKKMNFAVCVAETSVAIFLTSLKL